VAVCGNGVCEAGERPTGINSSDATGASVTNQVLHTLELSRQRDTALCALHQLMSIMHCVLTRKPPQYITKLRCKSFKEQCSCWLAGCAQDCPWPLVQCPMAANGQLCSNQGRCLSTQVQRPMVASVFFTSELLQDIRPLR